MVAIVTGAGVGLAGSSKEVLGSTGELGSSVMGRGVERVTVNAATGNLVVQGRDEFLARAGTGIDLLRTYNSLGAWDGDNGDNWRVGYYRKVSGLSGTLNSAGSTIKRIEADGHESLYTFDVGSGRYITSDGGGAYDSLSFDAGTRTWTWVDGVTGASEIYKTVDSGVSYRLEQIRDAATGADLYVSYGLMGAMKGLITSISSTSGLLAGGPQPYWTVTLSYDVNRRLTSVGSESGSGAGENVSRTLTRYGYDSLTGRLSEVVTDLSPDDASDGNAYRVQYAYDTNGRLSSLQQTDGSQLTVVYDESGRVKSLTDDAGRCTQFAYDTSTRSTTITDALGQVSTLKYTLRGQLEELSGAWVGGGTFKQQFEYSSTDDLLSSTNGKGEKTSYSYDAQGQLTRRVDAAGNVLERSYLGTLLSSETAYTIPDADGIAGPAVPGGAQQTLYLYDPARLSLRQVAYVVGPLGEVTRNLYDAQGRLTRQLRYVDLQPGLTTFTALESWATGAAGGQARAEVVDFAYDFRGQLVSESRYVSATLSGGVVVSTLGVVKASYAYDAYGRLVNRQDSAGNGTWYGYDGLNRIVQTSFGKVASGQPGNVSIAVTSYDDANRKTTVRLASGQATVQTFDTQGLLLSSEVLGAVTGASQGQTRYVYDKLGRLSRMQDGTGVQQWMLYDAAGNKTADIAANGQLTEYLYDGAGHLVQSVAYAHLLSAAQIALLADGTGAPTAATVADVRPAIDTANDRIATQYYDAAGRLTARLDAEGNLTEITYNGVGAVIAQTQYAGTVSVPRLSTASGNVLGASQLPVLVRPASDAADRSTRRLLDASGRLSAAIDSDGGYTLYAYDGAGRLLSTLRSLSALAEAQRTSASLEELRARPVGSGDEFTQWIYDQAGQRVAQVDAEGHLTEYAYDGEGRLKETTRYLSPVIVAIQADGGRFKTRVVTQGELGTLRAAAGKKLTESRQHNERGQLAQETDASGTVTAYHYDGMGRLDTVIRALGSAEERGQAIAYDEWGRENERRVLGDAQGSRTQYDAAGRRLSVTDARGVRTVFYYDAQGRETYSILVDADRGGEVQETIYSNFSAVQATIRHSKHLSAADCAALAGGTLTADLKAKVDALVDSADSRTRYSYNRRGQVQQAIDALGAKTDTRYNAFGEVVSVQTDVDLAGQGVRRRQLNLQYDRRGHVVSRTEQGQALSSTTTSRYDALGRLLGSTDAMGQETLYGYARDFGQGRQVMLSTAAGNRRISYDALDRVVKEEDPYRNAVTYAYDAANRELTVTTAMGISTTTRYNRHGEVWQIKDGAGQTSTYEYEAHGRLVRTTDASGVVSASSYDLAGNLIERVVGLKAAADGSLQTTGTEVRTRYGFDAANRMLIQTVDPDGLALKTTFEYDGQGRRVKVTDAGNVLTTQRFDGAGNLLETVVDDVAGGLKLKTSYSYDAAGRVLSVTEGAGTAEAKRTDYAYDELGRRVSQTVDPLGLKLRTTYEYDAAGRLTKQTDAASGVSAYRYDAAGHLQFEIDAVGAVVRHYTDANGRVIGSHRYATLLSGAWSALSAVALDAELATLPQASDDAVSSQIYDADGRLHFAVDATGAVSELKYDLAGHVVWTRRYVNPVNPGAEPLTESALSGMLHRDSARDQIQRQAYDAAGRLRFTVDAEGGVTETRYDLAGRVCETVQYAKAITWTADKDEQAFNSSDIAGLVIASEQDRHRRLAYDTAGRLRFEINAEAYVVECKLDGLGRTKERITYATARPGLLTGSVTTADISTAVASDVGAIHEQWEFDSAGRMASKTDGADSVTRYTYDTTGRLSTEVLASGTADQSTTRRVYDAAGRCIEVTRGLGSSTPSTTRYEYDALGQLRFEYGARGIEMAESDSAFARAERSRLGYAVLQADLTAADRDALCTAYKTERRYDAVGRLTQTIDALGGQTQTQYDAFGRAVMVTDARGYSSYSVYDKLGRVVQQIDAERYLTSNTYDSLGQLVETLRVDSRVQGTLIAGQAVTLVNAPPPNGTAFVLLNSAQDHLTIWTHDRANRVVSETDAEGFTESVQEVDAFGLKLSVRNKLGSVATFTYDRLGRVLTETLPVQARGADGQLKAVVNEYAYDARGNRIRSVEAKGLPEERTTTMRYDGADRLVLRIGMSYGAMSNDGSSGGIVTPADSYRYDAAGRLIEQVQHGQLQADGKTVAGGMRSVAGYNALGLKAWELSADRVLSTFQYDAGGEQVAQTIYANRLAESVTVPAQPSPPAVTADARNDRTLRTRYDALGRKTATMLDALYVWDSTSSGLVISGLQPASTLLQQYFYDAVGNVTERRDGRGNSSYEYFDGLGRRILSIDAGGAAIAWSYDRASRVATTEKRFAAMLPANAAARQANTRALESGANSATSLLTVLAVLPQAIDADRITKFTLDRLDRVTEQRVLNVEQDYIDTSGQRTRQKSDAVKQFQYNGLGAVTQLRELASQVGTTQTWETTDVAYDGMGREVRRQQAQFQDYEGSWVRPTTELEYDGLGHVARSIQRGKNDSQEADDRITQYSYDTAGHLVQQRDAAGAVTAFVYDFLGRISQQTRRDVHRSDGTTYNVVTSYQYDASGRVIQQKDTSTGVVRKTRYNAFGEVTARGLGDGWEEFAEYSTLGKVVKTNSGDGAVKFYLYDANGNLTREIKGSGDASVDLNAMTLEQASVSKLLYSRISFYDARNLLIKTTDPEIQNLKSSDVIGNLYTDDWEPTWTPPAPRVKNADMLKTATVSQPDPSVPLLRFVLPGTGQFAFCIYPEPVDYDYVGQFSSAGVYELNLGSYKGKGEQKFTYIARDIPGYSGDYATYKGEGTFTVDSGGRLTYQLLPQRDEYRRYAEIYLDAPQNCSCDYAWTLYDSDGITKLKSGVTQAYNQSAVYGTSPAVIGIGEFRPKVVGSSRQLYLKYSSSMGEAVQNISFSQTGAISTSVTPVAMSQPVTFYIKGRRIPKAQISIGSLRMMVPGTYVPQTATVPAYTAFTVDLKDLGGMGDWSYTLAGLDAVGSSLFDELDAPIVQKGRVVLASSYAPPSVLHQVTKASTSKVTVSLTQSFNAFGEVSEERDDRVEARMKAALNVAVLTQDQKDAARTTLRYNTLGQLIRKTEAETWVTAGNGFRYRARPETVYGYDLLGRHTTTQDANGNLNRVSQEIGARGETGAVAYEFDAMGGASDSYVASIGAGGVRRMQRDIFGDVRRITDAEGHHVEQAFDAMGRLISVTRKDVHRYDGSGTLQAGQDLSDRYSYDELGQRLSYVSALDQGKVTTDYDSLGRITRTVTAQGSETRYLYQDLTVASQALAAISGAASGLYTGGTRKTTLRADGRKLIDEQDYFGHQVSHTDLSGVKTTYKFNSASQLTDQTSTAHAGQTFGQNVHFDYYANGYVRALTDKTGGTSGEYAYDSAGNRIYEAYFVVNSAGVKLSSYQTSTIAYDELNRIVSVADDAKRETVSYEYDAVGNRRLVDAVYQDGAAGFLDRQTYWYSYDALNRFVVTKGQLSSTASTGDSSRFIKAPRGTSLADTTVSIIAGVEGTSLGYDRNSQRVGAMYTYNGKLITETYQYSDDGYLQNTRQGGVLMSVREIDAIGRTVRLSDYSAGVGKATFTTSTYDLDNKLTRQVFVDSGDSKRNYTSDYLYYDKIRVLPGTPYPADTTSSTNGVGALAKVIMTPSQGGATTTSYVYEYWDDAKQSQITKSAPDVGTGTTSFAYNANGQLVWNYDWVAKATNTYVTTANGLILSRQRKADSGRITNHFFYYADGHRIGDVGDTPDEITRVSYAEQMAMKEAHRAGKSGRTYERYIMRKAPPGKEVQMLDELGDSTGELGAGNLGYRTTTDYASTADFDQNFEPINDNYPSAAAFTYTVQRDAETLYSIAQGLWGDQSMWYLIAEVNGLSATASLKAGQLLVIPNKVTNIHNNSKTWRPYQAGEAIGKTDPTMPTPPPPKNGCGVIGTLIMVAVAVAVTVATQGAAANAMVGLAETTVGNAAVTAASYAAGAAAGSIASQAVGLAIGQIDQFSWRAVGQAALGGAITGGISYLASSNGVLSSLNGSDWSAQAGRMALSSATNMALHGDWNWQSVMVSAVSAGVGSVIGGSGADFGASFTRGVAGGIAATALTGGNRHSYETVFASALGSAIGESLGSPTTQDQGANNRTLLNAAERAADPDRYTSWKGQFPDLSQFYGQPWAGDNVVQAVDRSQDIQLAAGNGFRMGNGRINVSEPVNGRVYISDGLGSLSDADLIARTRAVLGQGNSATSARVNYLAAEAEATSNLYASGMGDVRTVLTMQGSSGDALQRITAQPIESLPSITAMNGWDSFLTFNPAGKLLSGVGGGVADLVQAPVVLAKEALLTTSDTIGQSVTGALNWLTDSNLNYRSDSALYRSIQTNGVLGTAGLAVTGTVKGIVAPIDALYRNDVNAFGRSLPGAAMATVGPLAKFGSAASGRVTQAIELTFDKSTRTWTTPAGLDYGPGSLHGNRVKHVLDHAVPNPNKTTHSVFNVDRTEVLGVVDEAWGARSNPLPNDPGAYVIPMGRTVGTAGETSIKIIVRPGTNKIITAYPWR